MSLLQLRIKGRLYGGFGVLVFFGVALAIFGIWQLLEIRTQVGKMSAIADNASRVLRISSDLQAIRRANLRYIHDADEASFKEATERETKTTELLQEAAKATLSEERRAIYGSVEKNVAQLRAKRETLGAEIKAMQTARATLFKVGDDLAANAAKFLDGARASNASLRDAAELGTQVLLVRIANWRFLATQDEKGPATFKTAVAKAQSQIAALEKADLPAEVRTHLAAVKSNLATYASSFETASANILKANELYRTDVRNLTVGSLQQLAKAQATLDSDFTATEAKTGSTISSTVTMQMIVAALAFVLGTVIAFFIARSIANPLSRLCAAMKELASGNFDVVLPGLGRKDEVGDIAAAVEEFKVKAADKARLEADETLKRQKAEAEAAASAAEERAKSAAEQARVVESLAAGLKDMADGDLTVRLSDGFTDAYLQIKNDFNAAIARLEDTIKAIADASREITSGAAEIATSTTDLSQRTEEQAASLEETSASMEQISATVKKNAENAQQANAFTASTREVADKGGAVVAQAVNAMARIEESSRKISDIISVIDEIARQTNLLALNAAVEAARAGEAGRGFAVVASEVRTLAQRSSQAAKDIKDLITSSSGQVSEGVQLVNKAGASLTEIVESIKKVAGIVSDIANASAEQATGIDQVNTALSQMDEVTQQNSALVEENAASAKSLDQQANIMSGHVAAFKLSSSAPIVSPVKPASAAPHAPKAPAPAAVAKRGNGPVGRLQAGLATALNIEQEWEEF